MAKKAKKMGKKAGPKGFGKVSKKEAIQGGAAPKLGKGKAKMVDVLKSFKKNPKKPTP